MVELLKQADLSILRGQSVFPIPYEYVGFTVHNVHCQVYLFISYTLVAGHGLYSFIVVPQLCVFSLCSHVRYSEKQSPRPIFDKEKAT